MMAENFGNVEIPAAEPLPLFRSGESSVGFVNLSQDDDGFIRRIYLFVKTPEYSGLSFPVTLVSNYLQQPLRREGSQVYRLGPEKLYLDGSAQNTALLGRWSFAPASRQVSAIDLLKDGFDPGVFRDKIVLMGESSTAGKDVYVTPLFRFRRSGLSRAHASGVVIQANAANALLSGNFVEVMPPGTQLLLAWGMTFVAFFSVIWSRPLTGILFSLLLMALGVIAAGLLFSRSHVWWRFVSAEMGIVLSTTAALGFRFYRERRLKIRAESVARQEANERQKLESEMVQARQIQESLLPASLPKLPGWDIAVQYAPCLEIGGDYYDFLQPDPSVVIFVIADVQGHGVSSALIMSNLQATLRTLVRGPQGRSPERIVAALNDALLEDSGGKRLVSLFLGLLDVSSREIRYVNAGHVTPLLLPPRNGAPRKLDAGGLLLGVFPGADYECGSVRLQRGDVFLACTDGITEASNASKEEYSLERMAVTAARYLERPASEIVENVMSDVGRFEQGGTHEDDKIVLVMRAI